MENVEEYAPEFAANADDATEGEATPEAAAVFNVVPAPEARIRDRVQKLMKVVLAESSLPIGLRSFMADEWSELLGMIQAKESDLKAIAWKVHAMVLTLGWCREVCSDANLIDQMKLLDIELGSYRNSLELRPQGGGVDVEPEGDVGYKSEACG